MPRNTYSLGGYVLTSQKQVKNHFKTLKEWTPDGMPIGPLDAGYEFLKDLFWRDPHAPPDLWPACFYFEHHDGWRPGAEKDRGVVIVLENLERWPFPSYHYGYQFAGVHLASPEARDKRMTELALPKLNASMRKMIRYQIETFRGQHPTGRCELCGEPGEHVDHHPTPFADIRDLFLRGYSPAERLALAEGIVDESPGQDGSEERFGDIDLYGKWCDDHLQYAELRLLCDPCHKAETHGKPRSHYA